MCPGMDGECIKVFHVKHPEEVMLMGTMIKEDVLVIDPTGHSPWGCV